MSSNRFEQAKMRSELFESTASHSGFELIPGRYGGDFEINITRTGLGDISFSDTPGYSFMIAKSSPISMLQPRGKDIRLSVVPDSQYQLSATDINGCNGSLVNGYYEIPARQDDCEITVNFTPIL